MSITVEQLDAGGKAAFERYMGVYGTCAPWEEQSEHYKDIWRGVARAVLEAARLTEVAEQERAA